MDNRIYKKYIWKEKKIEKAKNGKMDIKKNWNRENGNREKQKYR